ncbi:hypothetical protein PGT21_030202 [Puccinia graminis f. sp. tritici]|uniref:Uncharacterized protein n=1 Tax=Puccinia graminis f. sp. tritici TaxID=56615 RepID=A0A5B0R221_PUCGR|nr:hypothetical protein PGT21_030202 [Puccinia graminis f. sp. tritici]
MRNISIYPPLLTGIIRRYSCRLRALEFDISTLRALSRYNMPRSIHHCPGTTIRKVVADLHRNMQCQVAETFDFFLVFIQPHPSFTRNS